MWEMIGKIYLNSLLSTMEILRKGLAFNSQVLEFKKEYLQV